MNPSTILTCLRFNERSIYRLWGTLKLQRTFLSKAYQCQEAWDKRLESSILKNVKPIDFYMEIDQKLQSENKISAVDIDIFANCIEAKNQSMELADLIHRFRKTRDTTFTLESTYHAVVRYYMKINDLEQLLDILDDRLNYGIFCDHLCYNLLMNHFIKNQNFASAARVASFLMLQEDFEHPICNALAIYSCHKYLENPDTWQGVDPETLKEEPKEEVKIRVRYIRNPYFDDHFDLWKPSDLVGKTLFWIGQTVNDPLGRSCHLRGLILFRKYKDAISLLEKWKNEPTKEIIYKDVLSLIKKDVPEIFDDQQSDEEAKKLTTLLIDLENADLCQENFDEAIESFVKKAVAEHSQEDISKQIKVYDEWLDKRVDVLKSHLAELNRQERLAKVEEMKHDLVERERLLTFFENEEKIELEIIRKHERENELYGEEIVQKQDLEDNYIPPDVQKRRNQ